MYGKAYDPRRRGEDIARFFHRNGIPVTITLIACSVVTWFLFTVGIGRELIDLLAFSSERWPLPAFWSVVTWPLLGGGHPLWFLFAGLWAYFIGGSLERSWGSRTFALFLFGTAALTAVTTYLGSLLLGTPVFLAGLRYAMAAPTVAWCLTNRRETIGFFFVPVPAIGIAWFTAILLWYEVGPPFLGLFALSGCAAAYWYVTQGDYSLRSFGNSMRGTLFRRQRPGQEPVARFREFDRDRPVRPGAFNPFKWWKERQERKRLEDIFRRSGFTDDDIRR